VIKSPEMRCDNFNAQPRFYAADTTSCAVQKYAQLACSLSSVLMCVVVGWNRPVSGCQGVVLAECSIHQMFPHWCAGETCTRS
jgi:hypothetical protein